MKRTAEDYISQGWGVVPLVAKDKHPIDTNWQKKTYKPEAFQPNSNIGAHCGEKSEGRVDVDCDVPEAIKAAQLILPATLTHGRGGNMAHHWFHCVGASTRAYKDDVMLVELRATGQTMIPPSTHPSGDVLTWGNTLAPFTIEAAVLEDMVSDIAIVSFIARHWSELDHESMLPLAGMLVRAGIEPRTLFKLAAQICSPSEIAEVVKIADNTVKLFDAGRPVTGGRKLAEVLGVQPVARLRSILGGEDIDALEEMNERHFFVRMGKDSVIGRKDDPDEIVFQQPKALNVEYANRQLQTGTNEKGDPIYEPLFQGWLRHTLRRSYSKVVFAPPPLTAREDEYNLWIGFSVTPSRDAFLAGRCLGILNHIREIICDGDPERTEYLLNLLARSVQEPGEPLGICINMRGEQGSGKGVFVEYIGSLFHPHHYSHITNMDQAIGRFNKAILGKIIIFLDEAAAEAAQRNHGTFKSLTTDKTLQIELKGVDTNEVRNLAHLFTATNDEKSVPTEEGDRRGFYLMVSSRYAYQRCSPATRKAYFDALFREMSSADSRSALL